MSESCGETLALGVEDEAACILKPGHEGDHLVTWRTEGPDAVEAEIRRRRVQP